MTYNLPASTTLGAGARSPAAAVAAGIVLTDPREPDRATALEHAAEALRDRLSRSAVWQSAHLPADLRGLQAYGVDLPVWSPQPDLTPDEADALAAAWRAALPPLDRGLMQFLRLRVGTAGDAAILREIGEVDGLRIVPSLESAGSRIRPLVWRWPLTVGVLAGASTSQWLDPLRHSGHYRHVYDADSFEAGSAYDIAIVSAEAMGASSDEVAAALGRATCVIVAGAGQMADLLTQVDQRVHPTIAVAIAADPSRWWRHFFQQLSHDVPVDAAFELCRAMVDDVLLAGPRRGMDVTASAHWFAAVAGEDAVLEPSLDEFAAWDWRFEGGGSSRASELVRGVRDQGSDPVAQLPAPLLGETAIPPGEDEVEEATPPRRLIARVWDGSTRIDSVLPPERDLTLGVRIALPEAGDVAADRPAPALPSTPGPTVQLEVVLRGDVWSEQPAPQTISLSRERRSQPSTWAAVPFTTPATGVVEIEVTVLFQGKPLQAATFVSPVRAHALPEERPTLTTFTLSGPDEPTEDLRPVDVTLDGRGAELRHLHGGHATVLLTDVQAILDLIEDRVSRVLGVVGAPDTFDDPRAADLLIELARRGTELRRLVAGLDLEAARSINLLVRAETRVMPLELVYSGPTPRRDAALCGHVGQPPPPGQACDRATARRVCPYAFWGLHRAIARTIVAEGDGDPTTPQFHPRTVLYAATAIADEGSVGTPKPIARVLQAAASSFASVTQVTSWRAWRRAIVTSRPDILVVLGHTMVEGGETNLYIGRRSVLARPDITAAELRASGSPRPLVLLIACASAALGDPFGSLPGVLTARGAGAVVGTLSKIIGPQGASASTHLLLAVHDAAGTGASVGDAVTAARRSLVAESRPIGLVLVSHGEIDTKVAS